MSDLVLVLELAMLHRVTQPSKEQVRAYMAARLQARASGRRPPPSPEEIRALLGWRLERCDPHPSTIQFYRIPTAYSGLVATLLCQFMLAAMRISYVAPCTHKKFT